MRAILRGRLPDGARSSSLTALTVSSWYVRGRLYSFLGLHNTAQRTVLATILVHRLVIRSWLPPWTLVQCMPTPHQPIPWTLPRTISRVSQNHISCDYSIYFYPWRHLLRLITTTAFDLCMLMCRDIRTFEDSARPRLLKYCLPPATRPHPIAETGVDLPSSVSRVYANWWRLLVAKGLDRVH
jgi:hypothetical protein